MDLYDSAIQESSRRQYGTGQRAYLRFAGKLSIPGGFFPFQKRRLENTELTLAFFMAHLLLKPTIKKASTILCYEAHVKWMFRREGCDPEKYQTPFLQQVRKGLKKTLPSRRDSRSALILPAYLRLQLFQRTTSRDLTLLKFAAIIGFAGMLRPHTFDQLTRKSFVLVVKDVLSRQLSQLVSTTDMDAVCNVLRPAQTRFLVLGFLINFKAKTQLDAIAYLPNLTEPRTNYSLMCPVAALREVVWKGYFKKSQFLKTFGKGSKLDSYLKQLTEDSRTISPHALRIGGRTWYISQGMEKQFVDFLGTWASPEASARYYRETPAAVLRILQRFYSSLPLPEDLY